MTARRNQKAATPHMVTLPMEPLDQRLVAVEHGPDVMLTPDASAQIAEWTTGWLAADRLRDAGIPTPGPLLLHGPPGTGKTAVSRMLARQLAGVREVVAIDAMRVTEGYLGATSANIAKAADAAIKRGAILVLEEVDTLASARGYNSSAEVENARATTSIMRVLELPGPMIMTSNRIDVLDPAVMRRCEYVVAMPEPTPEHRRAIVARELGADPGPVEINLVAAIPIARRARRSALLRGENAAEVYSALCKALGPEPPR